MDDLTDLSSVEGTALTEEQINGILHQIDLDITNLVRDGKLSALSYATGGQVGRSADRAGNLRALLEARAYYQKLLDRSPSWNVTQFDSCINRGQR
jgi:hypothetical protein